MLLHVVRVFYNITDNEWKTFHESHASNRGKEGDKNIMPPGFYRGRVDSRSKDKVLALNSVVP
ncbi:hypothetical protein PTI98_011317 [Pleurotus ostreatus]|nr:hypothetical protein PTI98_011317 [Pleurotus ostreatus]